MAEKESGLVEGVLGAGEAEEREAEETGSRADDIATVVMMDAARFDPDLSKKAGNYLDKQSSLVELQVHHFDEERRLAIEAAKRKRFFEHIRMAFQLFLTLIASCIGIGAIVMVWDAVNSRSVVVDSFDISPNVASQVPSGKIVSAGLLDVLSRIQSATRSSLRHRSLSNAWANEIAIEIPETGLSIDQVERMLKARFGHDQHIDGDVVLTEKGGLALTVRGTGILAKTFTDESHNLDKLLTEAGEYIYGQSQPGLWTNYLSNNGRNDEAIRFAQAAYPSAGSDEKPYVLNSWGNAIASKGGPGSLGEALLRYREAVRQKPDYWSPYGNVMYALGGLGDEEGAVRVGEQLLQQGGGRHGQVSELTYQNYDILVWDLRATRKETVADMESHGGVGSFSTAAGSSNLVVAEMEALMHDVDAATLRVKTTPVDQKNASDVASAAFDRALLAEEVGDLATAAKEWDAFAAVYANPTVSTAYPTYMCFAAPSYEMTGQTAKADAALDGPMRSQGIASYVDCYRFRGDVLELRGDWTGAQAWYAKAVKLGPSIPSGYYSWGLALAKRGDLAGAVAQFKDANQKGPHWADPLKAWGDALVKQGYPKDALAKYDEALKYAPSWKQLKEARETAAKVAL